MHGATQIADLKPIIFDTDGATVAPNSIDVLENYQNPMQPPVRAECAMTRYDASYQTPDYELVQRSVVSTLSE